MRESKSRLPLFRSALLVGLLGAALLFICRWRNGQVTQFPVRTPLTWKSGARVQAELIAELSTSYELEVEFERFTLAKAEQDLLSAFERPLDLDISWSVRGPQAKVASGDAAEFAYLTLWQGRRERYINCLFALETYRDVNVSTTARGLGSFEAEAGERYVVDVSVDEPLEGFAPGKPWLNVRVNRRDWRAATRGNQWMGWGGLLLLGCGGLFIACGLLRVVMRRRQST